MCSVHYFEINFITLISHKSWLVIPSPSFAYMDMTDLPGMSTNSPLWKSSSFRYLCCFSYLEFILVSCGDFPIQLTQWISVVFLPAHPRPPNLLGPSAKIMLEAFHAMLWVLMGQLKDQLPWNKSPALWRTDTADERAEGLSSSLVDCEHSWALWIKAIFPCAYMCPGNLWKK